MSRATRAGGPLTDTDGAETVRELPAASTRVICGVKLPADGKTWVVVVPLVHANAAEPSPHLTWRVMPEAGVKSSLSDCCWSVTAVLRATALAGDTVYAPSGAVTSRTVTVLVAVVEPPSFLAVRLTV